MTISLTNKTILITGSTSGLGLSLAKTLVSLNANVILHGKDKDKLDSLLKQEFNNSSQVSTLWCDVTTPKDIPAAFSTVGHLDILINNCGIWEEGDSVAADPLKIEQLVATNLTSYLLITRTLLPLLLKNQFSQILNVSSTSGIEVPSDYYHTYYSGSKYGVRGFTEALVKEFHNKPLRVMGIYPGGMSTPLFGKAGQPYTLHEPWMFDPQETVDAIIFMLTRNEKVNIKRLDILNHLEV